MKREEVGWPEKNIETERQTLDQRAEISYTYREL